MVSPNDHNTVPHGDTARWCTTDSAAHGVSIAIRAREHHFRAARFHGLPYYFKLRTAPATKVYTRGHGLCCHEIVVAAAVATAVAVSKTSSDSCHIIVVPVRMSHLKRWGEIRAKTEISHNLSSLDLGQVRTNKRKNPDLKKSWSKKILICVRTDRHVFFARSSAAATGCSVCV